MYRNINILSIYYFEPVEKVSITSWVNFIYAFF
jgi:hypothetical protein